VLASASVTGSADAGIANDKEIAADIPLIVTTVRKHRADFMDGCPFVCQNRELP
jgi:hypothetical protein